MSDFRPDPRLCGLSRKVFDCFGKPHIMCHYEGRSIGSHALDEGAWCACCGRPATNAHHWPAGRRTVEVAGKVLRPSLIAVCGSGTTGCHDGFHGGARFDAEWSWDDEGDFERWLNGDFWETGYEAHDPRLYLHGCWILADRRTGRTWSIRSANL